ncbi:pyridoxamine 5'-phosphate oxidase family protein [Methylibium sp.]|uniref:pyridoxamine 5'-phosphate oxidase family protein n=1 Tax=Methylibium sp. TaxID=2067992 RepID=UPI003D0DE3D5
MSRAYADLAFTPAVRALQTQAGSRTHYARLDHLEDRGDSLTDDEVAFITARDGFYQATVSETGWPYVQYRGGAKGFLEVIDDKTLGYADVRGNRQYISAGNLTNDDRVALFLMDYATQRRLKIMGRALLLPAEEGRDLLSLHDLRNKASRVERVVMIRVEAFDWNCPQHITPRFTLAEVAELVAPLQEEVQRLRQALSLHQATAAPSPGARL